MSPKELQRLLGHAEYRTVAQMTDEDRAAWKRCKEIDDELHKQFDATQDPDERARLLHVERPKNLRAFWHGLRDGHGLPKGFELRIDHAETVIQQGPFNPDGCY